MPARASGGISPPFKFGSPELFFTFELFINEALYNFYALALFVPGLP